MHASKYKVHQLPPRYTRLKLPGSWIVRLGLSSADHLLLLQAWGAVTTWATDDRLLTAGTIAQGLTPAELSSMSITLQDLEALGQYAGWTPEQVRPFTSSSLALSTPLDILLVLFLLLLVRFLLLLVLFLLLR